MSLPLGFASGEFTGHCCQANREFTFGPFSPQQATRGVDKPRHGDLKNILRLRRSFPSGRVAVPILNLAMRVGNGPIAPLLPGSNRGSICPPDLSD